MRFPLVIEISIAVLSVITSSILLAAAPLDRCTSDLTALSGPLDETGLTAHLRQLARFALDEVQKRDQPNSAKVGLLEDLKDKLEELARRSGHPLAEIEKRLLIAKREVFFSDSSPKTESARERELRKERKQIERTFRNEIVLTEGPARAVAFSPDGRYLSVVSSAGEHDPGGISTWETASYAMIRFGTGGYALAFHPGSSAIAVSNGRLSKVNLWGARGGFLSPLRGGPFEVLALAFSPDGTSLGGCTGEGTVVIWEAVDKANPVFERGPSYLGAGERRATSVAFSVEGKLAVSYTDGIAVWDSTSKDWIQNQGRPLVRSNPIRASGPISFSADGKKLAVASGGGFLEILDVDGREPARSWRAEPVDDIASVAFSPDGSSVASGSAAGQVQIWDTENLNVIQELSGGKGHPAYVAFSPDGERLAIAGASIKVLQRPKW